MLESGVPSGSVDLIWSEGALYNVGVEPGLRVLRELLAPGGTIAFSELCWLAEPAEEPLRFWQSAYPSMTTVVGTRSRIRRYRSSWGLRSGTSSRSETPRSP